MNYRRTQFGERENTASSRQHASRLTNVISSKANQFKQQLPVTDPVPRGEEHLGRDIDTPLHAAPKHAAAEGRTAHECNLLTVREVAALLQVPMSWVYGRMRKRSVERLPGYRLGRYLRFREEELMTWLASQRRDSHAT